MYVELLDDIVESNTNPTSATDGWGSLEENEGRYWFNKTTRVKFYHNGTNWVNYDSADGMSVSRTGLTLTSTNPSDPNINIENIGGNLTIGGFTQAWKLTGTLADMLSFPNPPIGAEFLAIETNYANNKFCFYNGDTWQVGGETFQTQSAEALPIGSVVENDPTIPDRVRKATHRSDRDIIGVVVFTEATGAGQNVTVAYAGRWDILCVSGQYDQTNYIDTSNVDGQGQKTSYTSAGLFARPLESTTIEEKGAGLVKCILFNTERY